MPILRIAAAFAAGAMTLSTSIAAPASKVLPSNPTAATLPIIYTSAFANTSQAEERQPSPDKLWRQSNANVASTEMDGAMDMGSHAGSSDSAPAHSVQSGQGKSGNGAPMSSHRNHDMPAMNMNPEQGIGATHRHELDTKQK
jgi:hypothetical protein